MLVLLMTIVVPNRLVQIESQMDWILSPKNTVKPFCLTQFNKWRQFKKNVYKFATLI